MPMPKSQIPRTVKQQSKRDVELCKVVFSAAISQVLYSKRTFPSECFQLLPLREVLSRSFDDIVASGFGLQNHDTELLRDQENTVFLRHGEHYDLRRFLGILKNDIFPLIEAEGLVKFRINYLRTRTWAKKSLIEYYTVAVKYGSEGAYELDIWRAGTGKHHIATTDTQLWNLGDYLSRLPTWTDPLYWTLAFHAAERPDSPPVGLWKFDRTDFDDANLDLQQRSGYAYARLVRLEILPLTTADCEQTVSEPILELESETSVHQEQEAGSLYAANIDHARAERPNKSSTRRSLATGQPSPPLTLPSRRSSRKSSKAAATDKAREVNMTDASHGKSSGGTRKPSWRKNAKRKPKRPLQLFETAASSLPATQVIGDSQPLGQNTQIEKAKSHAGDVGVEEQATLENHALRSPSFDPLSLLDGISLSPEAISVIQCPRHEFSPLPMQLGDGNQEHQSPSKEDQDLLRPRPSPSVTSTLPGLAQWESRASPPANLLGITLSDEEQDGETRVETTGDKDITFEFSPNTVTRRSTMFAGILSSSADEE